MSATDSRMAELEAILQGRVESCIAILEILRTKAPAKIRHAVCAHFDTPLLILCVRCKMYQKESYFPDPPKRTSKKSVPLLGRRSCIACNKLRAAEHEGHTPRTYQVTLTKDRRPLQLLYNARNPKEAARIALKALRVSPSEYLIHPTPEDDAVGVFQDAPIRCEEMPYVPKGSMGASRVSHANHPNTPLSRA